MQVFELRPLGTFWHEANIIMIIRLFQTRGRGPYHKRNHRKQEHKKWFSIAHYRIGACTRPTLIGAKHSSYSAIHS